ncbi:MAG TPA: multicopper oxidase domain-containing protein [Gaiellales bacterium]|nr:multicopper oxidase domain-containing protein [Gaiellales bacterium]
MPNNGSHTHFEVAVIGAGQAGLAIGRLLAGQDRRFLILDGADSIGAAWRDRWDSLVLFTPRRYDSLPGLSFPGDPGGYPTRDEVVGYLEQYAITLELPIKLDSTVRSLAKNGRAFQLELDSHSIEADQVVIATGPFQTPRVPRFAGELAPEVFQAHSLDYRRPSNLPDGTALVVGGGNTGYQIATELTAKHQVHLAIGTRQTPLPQRLAGRDLFWWLQTTKLLNTPVDSRLGQKLSRRDTLIGSSPRAVKRHGVQLKPRATDASERSVTFADGTELAVDGVIWATGFGLDHAWIDLPVFGSQGEVVHQRGVTAIPGLYFLGLPWQHTRGSALLGWVKDDAEYIARHIAAFRSDAPAETTRAGTTAKRRAKSGRSYIISERPYLSRESEENQMSTTSDQFPSETVGLPKARLTELVELADGDQFDLRIAPVTKRLGDATVRMLAYNDSIPGPTLKVKEGSEVVVNVENQGDLEATVHWHGLRLENRYDGTHQTQQPMAVGDKFSARITFPDPGLYWYHPHIREDYGQEMGLYGNVLVEPADPDYWPPAHRDVVLTLDDVLLEDGKVAPFSRTETTYSAMGRFGDVLLVGGETDLSLTAQLGEVVRFYLTNTANTRVFKVALPGARMKLVGGDSGHVEREDFVDSVVLAPSERVVVDVLFDQASDLALEHHTPDRVYRLASIHVSEQRTEPALEEQFEILRANADMVAERERITPYLDAEPDKALAFIAEMDMDAPDGDGPTVYACPMHPEVVSDQPGHCPQCGMKLLAVEAPAATYTCPMHPEVITDEPGHCPQCGMKLLPAQLVTEARGGHEHIEHDRAHEGHDHAAAGGIEWEDDMVEVNKLTTPANMRWKLIDRSTGAENAAIDWQFRVGDQVKIRLLNEMAGDHPMHHPFHIHGAGRFLILARDDVAEPNLVWSDTVLVRTGETVDILLDVTNPGLWMAHCHIAEHHESGMMFSFNVTP